jgi:hypothetical protein
MIALPEGTSRQAANRTAYISHLWDALEIRFLLTHTDELVKQQLTDFAEVYDLSLRRMERIMSHVALAAAAAGPRRLVIAPLLVGLGAQAAQNMGKGKTVIVFRSPDELPREAQAQHKAIPDAQNPEDLLFDEGAEK